MTSSSPLDVVRKHYRGVAGSLVLGNASLREGLGETMAEQPRAKGGETRLGSSCLFLTGNTS